MSKEGRLPGAALSSSAVKTTLPPSISTSRLDRAGSGAEVPELPGPFGPTDPPTPRTEWAPLRTDPEGMHGHTDDLLSLGIHPHLDAEPARDRGDGRPLRDRAARPIPTRGGS